MSVFQDVFAKDKRLNLPHGQQIKGRHRQQTLPLTSGDMSDPAARLSVLPSCSSWCQMATEQMRRSVSFPW